MQQNYNSVPEEATQDAVALLIAKFAGGLADRSEQLAERVHTKLYSVMTSDCPPPVEVAKLSGREYPPLFNDLRGKFQRISDSLDCIEYEMRRTEL